MKIETDKHFPALAAVGKASVNLYRCLCEFEDNPGCCAEYSEAWDTAVEAFIASLNAEVIG